MPAQDRTVAGESVDALWHELDAGREISFDGRLVNIAFSVPPGSGPLARAVMRMEAELLLADAWEMAEFGTPPRADADRRKAALAHVLVQCSEIGRDPYN